LVNIASSNIDALPKWHLPLQNYPVKSSTLALGAFFDKTQISVDDRFNNSQFTKIQDIKSVSQLLDITSHGFEIRKSRNRGAIKRP
jgi:hypothetical protein